MARLAAVVNSFGEGNSFNEKMEPSRCLWTPFDFLKLDNE